MRFNLAATGFFIAAILFFVAAAIQVLRLNAVNPTVVILAILFMIIAIGVHAASLKDNKPPVA